MASRSNARIVALALLYAAQGVPYGFAAEYLPVALRQAGFSLGAIAALGWLQLPWQLKFAFAWVADRPAALERARGIVFALQLALFVALAGYAWRPLREAPTLWFSLTAVCALVAATQDVFVDALAIRTLDESQRGLGNSAQVAGYRLGMLVGGAGLLLLIAPLGPKRAVLACSSVVLVAAAGARLLGPRSAARAGLPDSEAAASTPVGTVVRGMFTERTWPVVALALTYKLGLHMAGFLIKPMVVDAGWSEREIGFAVVTGGTTAGLLGALGGGLLHRRIDETRALQTGALLQAASCVPLLIARALGMPRAWSTVAILCEHFVTGVGTTVLFAALMTATRKRDAGLHYTLLTSANALAIGAGSTLGGLLADRIGAGATVAAGATLCLVPLLLTRDWRAAAQASRADAPSAYSPLRAARPSE